MVQLLKGQMQLARKFKVDDRLHASFLCEVLLYGSSKRISAQLSEEIADLCEALRLVNAQAHIRQIYINAHSPVVIHSHMLQELWCSVLGKFDRDLLAQSFSAAHIPVKTMLSYDEVESLLTQALVLRGVMAQPKDELLTQLYTEEPPVERSPTPVLLGSRDSPSVQSKQSQRFAAEEIVIQEPMAEHKSDHGSTSMESAVISRSPPTPPTASPSSAPQPPQPLPRQPSQVRQLSQTKQSSQRIPATRPQSPKSPPARISSVSNPSQTPPSPSPAVDVAEVPPEDKPVPQPIAVSPRQSLDPGTPLAKSPSPMKRRFTTTFSSMLMGSAEKEKSEESAAEAVASPTITRRASIGALNIFKRVFSSKDVDHELSEADDTDRSHGRGVEESKSASPLQTSNSASMQLFDPADEMSIIDPNKKVSYSAKDRNIISAEQFDPTPDSKVVFLPQVVPDQSEWAVLNLRSKKLSVALTVDFLSTMHFSGLKVLVLRNNNLTSIEKLDLITHFPLLTDLDVGHNQIAGRIREHTLPRMLERLDLSFNQIADVGGLMTCTKLLELDLSNNVIKRLYGLPSTLKNVRLANNSIGHVVSLRSLGLCPEIVSITVKGNPVVTTIPNVKAFFKSIFRNVCEIDDVRVVADKRNVRSVPVQQIPSQPAVSKKQQQQNDASRSHIHAMQIKALEQAREEMKKQEDVPIVKPKVRPGEVAGIVNRLYTAVDGTEIPKREKVKPQLPSFGARKPASKSRVSASNSSVNLSKTAPVATSSSAVLKRQVSEDLSMQNDVLGDWLTKGNVEISRITSIFKIVFKLAKQDHFYAEDVHVFNNAIDRLRENHVADLSLPVRRALDLARKGDARVAEVNHTRSLIEKATILLHEIHTSLSLAMDGDVNFAHALDVSMNSKVGLWVDAQLLRQFHCAYHSHDHSSNIPPVVKGPSPAKKVVPAQVEAKEMEDDDDYVHRIQDLSLRYSPEKAQTVRHLDHAPANPTVSVAEEENAVILERMRTRLANKFGVGDYVAEPPHAAVSPRQLTTKEIAHDSPPFTVDIPLLSPVEDPPAPPTSSPQYDPTTPSLTPVSNMILSPKSFTALASVLAPEHQQFNHKHQSMPATALRNNRHEENNAPKAKTLTAKERLALRVKKNKEGEDVSPTFEITSSSVAGVFAPVTEERPAEDHLPMRLERSVAQEHNHVKHSTESHALDATRGHMHSHDAHPIVAHPQGGQHVINAAPSPSERPSAHHGHAPATSPSSEQTHPTTMPSSSPSPPRPVQEDSQVSAPLHRRAEPTPQLLAPPAESDRGDHKVAHSHATSTEAHPTAHTHTAPASASATDESDLPVLLEKKQLTAKDRLKARMEKNRQAAAAAVNE